MASRRLIRVGALIREEMGAVIQEGFTGAHEGIVSVTRVDVAPDLKSAKVFISIYGEEEQTDKSFKQIAESHGIFKKELSRRVRLRHIPDFQFIKDRSIEEGLRVSQLLDKIKEEREKHEDEGSSQVNRDKENK